MIEIEKNVPIPPRVRSNGGGRPPAIGRDAANAMQIMELNDSIKVESTVHKNTLYVFLARERKRTGRRYKFTVVSGGYRIWRIE